jgi:hypothetical protein
MNALSLELETASYNPAANQGAHLISQARPIASSYARKNYALAQAVYRADAIRRIAGAQAARTFLVLAGADAQLIKRVVSSSFNERRR